MYVYVCATHLGICIISLEIPWSSRKVLNWNSITDFDVIDWRLLSGSSTVIDRSGVHLRIPLTK